MKNILTVLIGLFSVLTTFGQDKKCCDTYVYKGYILTGQNKKLEINLNFLVLLDSTMVGSYYYDPNWGSLKLVGKLNPDFTFYLVERDKADSITGFFEGKLNTDYKLASGKWTDGKNNDKEIDFVVQKPNNEREYYQVAFTVNDEKTYKREISAFRNIKDNYPKYLLTLDFDTTNIDGIQKMNVIDWLLNE